MARNQFTFVNHASFMVRNDTAVLLIDPWVEGSAFNNGWSLLDRSSSNAALIADLNRTALPVFIWISHEHPDHFSIAFVKALKADARVRVTFLYQRTLDGRVAGFLRRPGFAVVVCEPGVPVALGHGMRIAVFPFSAGDSWALIQSGARTLRNLNDCVINTSAQCQDVKAKVAALAPRIDVLLTQFGHANRVGNPERIWLRHDPGERLFSGGRWGRAIRVQPFFPAAADGQEWLRQPAPARDAALPAQPVAGAAAQGGAPGVHGFIHRLRNCRLRESPGARRDGPPAAR